MTAVPTHRFRFTVEVLVGNRWTATAYRELPQARARRWLAFYQRQGTTARMVRSPKVAVH